MPTYLVTSSVVGPPSNFLVAHLSIMVHNTIHTNHLGVQYDAKHLSYIRGNTCTLFTMRCIGVSVELANSGGLCFQQSRVGCLFISMPTLAAWSVCMCVLSPRMEISLVICQDHDAARRCGISAFFYWALGSTVQHTLRQNAPV